MADEKEKKVTTASKKSEENKNEELRKKYSVDNLWKSKKRIKFMPAFQSK